eukprot:5407329-Pyramimonas_sp.AAC.1
MQRRGPGRRKARIPGWSKGPSTKELLPEAKRWQAAAPRVAEAEGPLAAARTSAGKRHSRDAAGVDTRNVKNLLQ